MPLEDSPSPPNNVIEFDSLGFILGVNDSLENLQNRWQSNTKFNQYIQSQFDTKGQFDIFDLSYKPCMRLNDTELAQCQKPISDLYCCQTPWVPAFFCNKGLSFIFGGMAIGFKDDDGIIQTDAEFSFFQLRSSFKHKEKFLMYTKTEIIAHESCHIARMALDSHKYEELLAYNISSSKFRRWWGSSIRKPTDVLLFFCGILLCLLSQVADIIYSPNLIISILGKTPFILLLIFFIIRNYKLHQQYQKAHQQLQKDFGKKTHAVLFRLTDNEIDKLSYLPWTEVSKHISEIRLEVINTFKTEETIDEQ